jgi:hypothetical protein
MSWHKKMVVSLPPIVIPCSWISLRFRQARSIPLLIIEPSDEMMGLAKLLAALVEHSADWFIARLAQNEVQALLGVVLRLTGWQGTGNVDEQISEVHPPFPAVRM